MPSVRYNSLSRRIYELRRNLLPRSFDPLGLYSDRVYERTRGFRVLAHAEFEAYIEDRCLEVVHKAHSEWKSKGLIRPCLLSLMAHHEAVAKPNNSSSATVVRLLGSIPDELSDLSDASSKYPTLPAKIETAKRHYSTYARKRNHGIKEKNLLLLLLPLGVEKGEIDTTWLNMTEGWATERGMVAHTSSAKMQVQVDPRSEFNTVKQILAGFQKMDGILGKK